jgi:hypothetical protein
MTDFVNFDEFEEPVVTQSVKSKYLLDGKEIVYDKTTMDYYLTLRKIRMDPIALTEFDSVPLFEFKYQWNPLTGERLDLDPYGPLCFHPHTLIRHFYLSRLTGLWVNESQVDGQYYQGYYDENVGAGEDIYIHGRGYFPERYLFRLPVIDCYWPDNFCRSAVTIGPKLTDDEIAQIDELATKCGRYPYSSTCPSLKTMKKYYDLAINPKPAIEDDGEGLTHEEKQQKYNQMNRIAVDRLRNMRG